MLVLLWHTNSVFTAWAFSWEKNILNTVVKWDRTSSDATHVLQVDVCTFVVYVFPWWRTCLLHGIGFYAATWIPRICGSTEYQHLPLQPLPLDHPSLVDQNLGTYGVKCLERSWDEHGQVQSLWTLDFLKEDAPCDWNMTCLETGQNFI